MQARPAAGLQRVAHPAPWARGARGLDAGVGRRQQAGGPLALRDLLRGVDLGEQGGTRLFAIGGDGNEYRDGQRYQHAYVGGVPQLLENRIQMIKGCGLVKQINGRTVDEETLLQAIDELGAKVEERFKDLKEVVVVEAMDPNKHDYFKWHGATILCEDPRLSLAAPGQQFKAIDLKLVQEPPVTLTPYEVEFLVDTIAGAMDIESIQTRAGTETHKLKWNILGSQHFANARTVFNRLTREALAIGPPLGAAGAASASVEAEWLEC